MFRAQIHRQTLTPSPNRWDRLAFRKKGMEKQWEPKVPSSRSFGGNCKKTTKLQIFIGEFRYRRAGGSIPREALRVIVQEERAYVGSC
jgi:hypothetical protein